MTREAGGNEQVAQVAQLSTIEAAELAGVTKRAFLKAVDAGRLVPVMCLVTDGPRKGRLDKRFSPDSVLAAYPQARAAYEARQASQSLLPATIEPRIKRDPQQVVLRANPEALERSRQVQQARLKLLERTRLLLAGQGPLRRSIKKGLPGQVRQAAITWLLTTPEAEDVRQVFGEIPSTSTLNRWWAALAEDPSGESLRPQWSACGRPRKVEQDPELLDKITGAFAHAGSYALATEYLQKQGVAISEATLRRVVSNLDPAIRMGLRFGARKSQTDLGPYVRRRPSAPFQCWSIDGHTEDSMWIWEDLLPGEQAKGFRPNIYAVRDVGSGALLSLTVGYNLNRYLPFMAIAEAILRTGIIPETIQSDTPAGTWALGGGLVVQIWVETLDGTPYPHTRLHLLDGAAHTWGDFATYEIIPQTIQPLALSGTPGSTKISGWYALAMETYLDDNFVVQRRLRFLALNRSFAITNGEYETPALFPTVVGKFGDIIAESMPDGAVPVRMIRTGVGDTMEGFFGGRLFGISTKLSTTVDCLQIGDLSAADYVEQFANTVLASAIPDNSGNMRLVSRGSGPLRVRPIEGQSVSIQAIERGPRKTLQTYRSYISEVRISYTDLVSGESREATYAPGHDGGKPINMDMSNLVGGVTAARAIGRAFAYWFGPPCGVITETWVDHAPGVASGLSPAFWSAWNVGDLITFVIHATGSTTPLVAYKIHQFKPRPEAREVGVELLKLPVLINPEAP